MKAWTVELWDAVVCVAARTRGQARYTVAKMAADAWCVETGEALVDVTSCVRAPRWDLAAETMDKPGSLHPLEQWQRGA